MVKHPVLSALCTFLCTRLVRQTQSDKTRLVMTYQAQFKSLSALSDSATHDTQHACSMYMCLSRLPVLVNVVQQQDVICQVNKPLVLKNERVLSVIKHHKNERVLSVIRQQDDISQLCVVVILSPILQAYVVVEVLLIVWTASYST